MSINKLEYHPPLIMDKQEPQVEKEQLLTLIAQSNDYNELAQNDAFSTEFARKYSTSVLKQLTLLEIEQRYVEMQNIANMFWLLQRSVYFGNAPELLSTDAPSFDDMHSVMALSEKIRVYHSRKNYSNIDQCNILKLFDKSTIKSATECFDLLPLSVARSPFVSERDLKKVLGDKLFCVDAQEISVLHKNFLERYSVATQILETEQTRRKRHRLFKIAVVMLLIMIAIVCKQLELFTPQYFIRFVEVVFILSLVLLLGG